MQDDAEDAQHDAQCIHEDSEDGMPSSVLPAHRYVLAQQSDVFKAMFSSPLREAQDGVIHISDISKDAFHYFLQSLYTGTLPGTPSVLQLINLLHWFLFDTGDVSS